jgi:DNA replication protein DnaC
VRELTCEQCGGIGFEIVESEGRQFARQCACRRPSDAQDVLAGCRIPRRYEHCSLATFEPNHVAPLVAALNDAMRFASGYPFSGEHEGLGLLFTGGNGVGKTHLAVAVLRELVTKGARGEFWDFNDLIRTIKSSYNPETRTTEEQVLDPVVSTDVLLLDDLGAWKMTDWMVDTLFYILNSRYLAKRVTLITTNFQDVDREAAVGADNLERREFLVERIGLRLRSRLMEMCLVIRMSGDDYRNVYQAGKQQTILGRSDPSQDRGPRRRSTMRG